MAKKIKKARRTQIDVYYIVDLIDSRRDFKKISLDLQFLSRLDFSPYILENEIVKPTSRIIQIAKDERGSLTYFLCDYFRGESGLDLSISERDYSQRTVRKMRRGENK